MSRISDNIKKLRLKKGLSQKQLGKSLGVSEGYINDIETGKKVINESIINKLSKIFGEELNDINMSYDEEASKEPVEVKTLKTKASPSSDVFVSAFSSVLKEIPFLNYELKPSGLKRLLPLVGNKIEGISSDKVFFTEVQNNNLSFLRILKGDTAFCSIVKEFSGRGVYLLNLNGNNEFYEVKELDKEKYLLIHENDEFSKNKLQTQSISKNTIKFLGKIIKVEFKV